MLASLGWVFFSLLAAIGSAGMYLVNQYVKVPGVYLVIMSRIFVILATVGPSLYFGMPTDHLFYLGVGITAVVGVMGDVRVFNVSAKYGGGVTSRVMPLQVFGGFLLWLAIHPEQIGGFFENPLRGAGVLLAMSLCIWFSSRLHRCHVSKKAFIELLPAIFFYAITITFNKFAVDHAEINSGVYNYMFVQCLMAVPMFGVYGYIGRKKHLEVTKFLSRKVLIGSLIMFATWVGHMIFKLYAMAWTENPAYVASIILTAPLWISLYYKLTGHKEDVDVRSGYGVVLSAILLALFTAHR